MRRVVFAIPGDLATATGGYAYARRLLHEWAGLGLEVAHLPLPGGFPAPDAGEIATAVAAMNAGAAPEDLLLIDGLACGALPESALAQLRAPFVALHHHPLCCESGLAPQEAQRLFACERAALARARAVIATSGHSAGVLRRDFGVADENLTVAEPGTDPAPRATPAPGAPLLLAVGALTPRKGFDLLVEALAGLRALDWRLEIVGSTQRDPATAADLDDRIARHGLQGRIALRGEIGAADLAAAYARSALFVSAARYEGYGMALAEALARGLPLVASRGGAAQDTIPDSAALKVAPGDGAALQEALGRALTDCALRKRLAAASWEAGQRLPRWRDTAMTVAAALGRL